MPTAEPDDFRFITRLAALETGKLVVQDRGDEWYTTTGEVTPRPPGFPVWLPVVSPDGERAIDLEHVGPHDEAPIVELTTARVLGWVPRSARRYVWLTDDAIAVEVEVGAELSIVAPDGSTRASFPGAHAMCHSRDGAYVACRVRGVAHVIDVARGSLHAIGRGMPLAITEDARVAVRAPDGNAWLVPIERVVRESASGSAGAPDGVLRRGGAGDEDLGRCEQAAIDARGRLVGAVHVGDGTCIAIRRGDSWEALTDGPHDRAPAPHPRWHWIAFERGLAGQTAIWITSHDATWRVGPGVGARWRGELDGYRDPMKEIGMAARARERAREWARAMEGGRSVSRPLTRLTRPREPAELAGAPRPSRDEARAQLVAMAKARMLLDWSLDAPMSPRDAAAAEARGALDAARLVLEVADSRDLTHLTGDEDQDVAAEARAELERRAKIARIVGRGA